MSDTHVLRPNVCPELKPSTCLLSTDGDIDDKFSVLDRGDLRPKMDRVSANCTLSVEEGGVGFPLSVDS